MFYLVKLYDAMFFYKSAHFMNLYLCNSSVKVCCI